MIEKVVQASRSAFAASTSQRGPRLFSQHERPEPQLCRRSPRRRTRAPCRYGCRDSAEPVSFIPPQVAITLGYRHHAGACAPIDAGKSVADTGKVSDFRYCAMGLYGPHMQEL